jgi:hypothetical protein
LNKYFGGLFGIYTTYYNKLYSDNAYLEKRQHILVSIELDTGSQDYDVDAYFSNITYSAIYNSTSPENTTVNCIAYSDTTNVPIHNP